MTALRILIIDDEELLLRAWSRLLGREHRVSIAHGGAAGLAALEALPPGDRFDAVLLDLSMPDVDGIEVYERACRRFAWFHDHVVFLTGGANDPRRAAFLESCDRPRLLKPFARAALEAALAEVAAPAVALSAAL